MHTQCKWFKQKTLEGEEEWLYSCEVNLAPLKENVSDVNKRREFVEEMMEILSEYCKPVSREGDVIRAVCHDDIHVHVEDEYYEYARDVALSRVEDFYYDEVLPSFKEEWEKLGREQPIPLDCDVTYAYPHMGGFYYYARCEGKKDYDLSLDEVAKSYKDIHDTVKNFVENVEETWYY